MNEPIPHSNEKDFCSDMESLYLVEIYLEDNL